MCQNKAVLFAFAGAPWRKEWHPISACTLRVHDDHKFTEMVTFATTGMFRGQKKGTVLCSVVKEFVRLKVRSSFPAALTKPKVIKVGSVACCTAHFL